MRGDGAQADAHQAKLIGPRQAAGALHRVQRHTAGLRLFRHGHGQGGGLAARAVRPGKGDPFVGGCVGDDGLEAGGDLAGVRMDQQLDEPGLAVAHLDHPADHMQGGAGMGLLQEADVLLADQQGRGGVGPKGVGHADQRGQRGQTFDGLDDIEAHIHVPHLVAFPGVDAPAPELSPVERHQVPQLKSHNRRRGREPRWSLTGR
jgi:hypothetical protein